MAVKLAKLHGANKVSQLKPLPSNPTSADLAKAIEQVHECVEQSKTETITKFTELDKKVDGIKDSIGLIVNNQTLIVRTFNINEKTANAKHVPFAMMPQKKAMLRLVGITGSTFTAIFMLVKFLEVSWPFAWTWLIAVHKAFVR